MIDGVAGHPFSAETLPPPVKLEESNREKIIRASRERYGVKREIVEEKISRWAGFGDEENENVNLINVPQKKGQQNITPQQKPDKRESFAKPQNFSGQQGGETKLYDAICSNCGKPTKVIFPPKPGRAVYCKSCLKKIKEGHGHTHETKNTEHSNKENLKEELKIENVSFHNSKISSHIIEKTEGHRQDKPHRREINLSELKKALEESLENKDELDNKKEIGKIQKNSELINKKSESSKKELQDRIESEREMDKFKDDSEGIIEENKKVIKPGEKIKL